MIILLHIGLFSFSYTKSFKGSFTRRATETKGSFRRETETNDDKSTNGHANGRIKKYIIMEIIDYAFCRERLACTIISIKLKGEENV
jgi:hypothetical protein